MDTVSILMLILAGILVIGGLVGLIVPLIPGPPLLLAGLILAAWAEDFAFVGFGTITTLVLLAVLAYIIDFVAGALGAKRYGASKRAAIGAVIGAIVGIFFGLIGVIIGPFIGAFIGQLSEKSDLQTAGKAGFGAWLGLIFGTAAKVALGFCMLGIYIFVRFF
jgi:uncharacterized protein YqgC (DUF456 family)